MDKFPSFRRSALFAGLATAAVSFLFAPLLPASGLLPNLSPGSVFQIAFVTADNTAATSTNIADYNSFVTNEADKNPLLAGLGVTWHCIGSTSASGSATNNAPQSVVGPFYPTTPPFVPYFTLVPVYTTFGELIADATDPLYGSPETLHHAIDRDQYDTASTATSAWTGLQNDGTQYPSHPLGSSGGEFSGPAIGDPQASTGGNWWSNGVAGGTFDTTPLPVYALSGPIIVWYRGDANRDGTVDINDLTIVLANFGKTSGMSWKTGDFNGDGRVDVNDLTALLANFGSTIPYWDDIDLPGGTAPYIVHAVPEPSTLALALVVGAVGSLASAWRKRRLS